MKQSADNKDKLIYFSTQLGSFHWSSAAVLKSNILVCTDNLQIQHDNGHALE